MQRVIAALLSVVLLAVALFSTTGGPICMQRRATCTPMACCDQPVPTTATWKPRCCPDAATALTAQPQPPLPREGSAERLLPPSTQPVTLVLAEPPAQKTTAHRMRRGSTALPIPHLLRSPVLRI